MLKAVFFDAAGTLFEAKEPVGHTYARIAAKHGLKADDAVVSAGFRRAFSATPGLAFGPGHSADGLRSLEREWWRELVRKSFHGLGEFDDFDRFFDELFAYFGEPAHWEAVAEADEVLRNLQALGLRLGVISNFDYRLYRILDGLGLHGYFDSVTISSEAGFAKPNGRIFAAALAAAAVECAEAMHIGDSAHMDLEGAQGAGLGAILIDVGLKEREQINPRAARVPSLASAIEVVQLLRT